jgi:hypothetical protein
MERAFLSDLATAARLGTGAAIVQGSRTEGVEALL